MPHKPSFLAFFFLMDHMPNQGQRELFTENDVFHRSVELLVLRETHAKNPVERGPKPSLGPHHAMMAWIGFPWSISKRFRPGISKRRESSPSCCMIVACTSVT